MDINLGWILGFILLVLAWVIARNRNILKPNSPNDLKKNETSENFNSNIKFNTSNSVQPIKSSISFKIDDDLNMSIFESCHFRFLGEYERLSKSIKQANYEEIPDINIKWLKVLYDKKLEVTRWDEFVKLIKHSPDYNLKLTDEAHLIYSYIRATTENPDCWAEWMRDPDPFLVMRIAQIITCGYGFSSDKLFIHVGPKTVEELVKVYQEIPLSKSLNSIFLCVLEVLAEISPSLFNLVLKESLDFEQVDKWIFGLDHYYLINRTQRRNYKLINEIIKETYFLLRTWLGHSNAIVRLHAASKILHFSVDGNIHANIIQALESEDISEFDEISNRILNLITTYSKKLRGVSSFEYYLIDDSEEQITGLIKRIIDSGQILHLLKKKIVSGVESSCVSSIEFLSEFIERNGIIPIEMKIFLKEHRNTIIAQKLIISDGHHDLYGDKTLEEYFPKGYLD